MQRALVLVGVTILWSALTVSGKPAVDPVLLPSPISVAAAAVRLVANQGILLDIAITLRRLLLSLILSITLGLPTGLFLGSRPTLYESLEGMIHGLRSIPATALFPLLLLVLGVGEMTILAIATYPGALIIIVNAATGAMLADSSRVRQGRALGMSERQLVVQILFFEALPLVLAGIRTVVSYALVLVIAIEMFVGVGRYGLGRRIFDLQSNYLVPEVYAAIAVTAAIGIGLNWIVDVAELYLLRWRPDHAKRPA